MGAEPMTVDVAHRETDPDAIGVHTQDYDGVCVSLGDRVPWVHLSWTCIEELRGLLAKLPR